MPILGCAFLAADYYFTALSIGVDGLSSLYHLVSYHHQAPSKKMMIKELSFFQSSIVIMTDDESILDALDTDKGHIYYELSPGFYRHSELESIRSRGIPLVGTYRVRMKREEDFYYYRLLRAIKENRRYSEKEYANLCEKFSYLPDEKKISQDFLLFPDAIENTMIIAKLCELKNFNAPLIFPRFKELDDKSSENLLWQKCIEGVGYRYEGVNSEVLENVQKAFKL